MYQNDNAEQDENDYVIRRLLDLYRSFVNPC